MDQVTRSLISLQVFSGGAVVRLPANAGDGGDVGSAPGLGRSPGGGGGNSLQYSLENSRDRGAWGAYGIARSQTGQSETGVRTD